MSTSPRRSALLIGVAPARHLAVRRPSRERRAAPVLPGSGPADLIVNELQALGYTVSINWTNGQDSSPPLSGCRVISFHNPDRSGTSAPQGTTVYVDVLCPNESED